MLKKQQQIKIQYYNKIKNEQNNKQPLQEIKQENIETEYKQTQTYFQDVGDIMTYLLDDNSTDEIEEIIEEINEELDIVNKLTIDLKKDVKNLFEEDFEGCKKYMKQKNLLLIEEYSS
jgi:cellulose synthase/poly-beta-1,6-N-acetylglucosamine synthase-like glycosyltransferase